MSRRAFHSLSVMVLRRYQMPLSGVLLSGSMSQLLALQMLSLLLTTAAFCSSSLPLSSSSLTQAPLHLFDPHTYPHARCLDGTQGGLYFRPAPTNASAHAKSSYLVVLEGGGLCTHQSDCVGRVSSHLGSSKFFTPEFNLSTVSYLSRDTRNPFRDWNLAYVPYCSGDMWSGRRTVADNATTYGLYFSGWHLAMATIDYLSSPLTASASIATTTDNNNNNNNSSNSNGTTMRNGGKVVTQSLNKTGNTLVWSGGSAGGVGAITSVDDVRERLMRGGVRVVGAPVGGFPNDVTWAVDAGVPNATAPPEDARTLAFARNNALYGAVPHASCARAMGAENAYKCLVPHLLYPYVVTPLFITQAITDAVIMCGFEGLTCSPLPGVLLHRPVWRFISDYGANASVLLRQAAAEKASTGLFAASCLIHTRFALDGPLIDGVSAPVALYAWVVNKTSLSPSNHDSIKRVGGVTTRRMATHRYMDTCLTGKYMPPCGKHCPALP